MPCARPVLAVTLLCAPLLACPGKAPPRGEGPAPRVFHVPKGCEKSQAGDYYHAQNPAFRYRGEDDGGTLVLSVLRAQEDGGVREEAAADGGSSASLAIHLERTEQGFVGETRAVGYTQTGAECPIRFPTEVVSCSERALTLRAADKALFDEQCQPPPPTAKGPARTRTEQVLVRGAPDAGTP
jgi:hypothetical protein